MFDGPVWIETNSKPTETSPETNQNRTSRGSGDLSQVASKKVVLLTVTLGRNGVTVLCPYCFHTYPNIGNITQVRLVAS